MVAEVLARVHVGHGCSSMNGMATASRASRRATLVCVNAAGLIRMKAVPSVRGGVDALDRDVLGIACRQLIVPGGLRQRGQLRIDGRERGVAWVSGSRVPSRLIDGADAGPGVWPPACSPGTRRAKGRSLPQDGAIVQNASFRRRFAEILLGAWELTSRAPSLKIPSARNAGASMQPVGTSEHAVGQGAAGVAEPPARDWGRPPGPAAPGS